MKAGLKEIVMRAQREGKVGVTDSAGRPVDLGPKRRAQAVNMTNAQVGKIVDRFTLTVGLGLRSINEAGKSTKGLIRARMDVKAAVTRAWEGHPDKPRIVTPYKHLTTFHCAGNLDPMNMFDVWGKPAIDALVNLGALVDDTAAWDNGGAYGPVVLNAAADAAVLEVWAAGAEF